MKSVWKCLVQSSVAVCVSAGLSTFVSAQDAGQAGIVRISRPVAQSTPNGAVTPVSGMMADNSCTPPIGPTTALPDGAGAMNGLPCPQQGMGGVGCPVPNGMGSGIYSNTCPTCPAGPGGFGGMGGHPGYYYNPNGHAMLEYLKCKFGYFIPSGGGGRGVPWVGKYARVYPVNPYYRDSRDGQLWAAQGYGMPMAVPLAPVVGHTFDYSWGIPSARLTPVSNPAY